MAIALVQSPALDRSASAPGTTSQTYTWGTKPTVGNKVIWAISQYDVAATATITDNASPANTFTARLNQNAGNVREWLFEGDIDAVPAGSYVTTLNYTATCYPTIAPQEYSGLQTGNSYDTGVTVAEIGSVPNPIATGNTATLAQADSLVISLCGVTVGSNSGMTAPSTGYTLDQVEQDGIAWMPIGLAHKIVSSTTAQSASWPNTGGGGDGCVLVAVFKGAASVGLTGTLAWTEADDTAAITGAGSVSGTAAWTEANDTAALTGTVRVGGTAAWTEANDGAALTGSLSASGVAGWTETDDLAALTGTVGNVSVDGVLSWTEDADAWAISGSSAAVAGRTPGGSGGGPVFGETKTAKAKTYNYDFSPAPEKAERKAPAEIIKSIASKALPQTAMAEALKRLEATLPDLAMVRQELEQERELTAKADKADKARMAAQEDDEEAIATLMAMLL